MDAAIELSAVGDFGDLSFDVIRIAFFDDQNTVFVVQKVNDFICYQGIDHIHAIDWNIRIAESVGSAQTLECPHHHGVSATLGNDAQTTTCTWEDFIDIIFVCIISCRGETLVKLSDFMLVRRRRQHNLGNVVYLFRYWIVGIELGNLVIFGDKAAGQMTGSNTHVEEYRHVGRFR